MAFPYYDQGFADQPLGTTGSGYPFDTSLLSSAALPNRRDPGGSIVDTTSTTDHFVQPGQAEQAQAIVVHPNPPSVGQSAFAPYYQSTLAPTYTDANSWAAGAAAPVMPALADRRIRGTMSGAAAIRTRKPYQATARQDESMSISSTSNAGPDLDAATASTSASTAPPSSFASSSQLYPPSDINALTTDESSLAAFSISFPEGFLQDLAECPSGLSPVVPGDPLLFDFTPSPHPQPSIQDFEATVVPPFIIDLFWSTTSTKTVLNDIAPLQSEDVVVDDSEASQVSSSQVSSSQLNTPAGSVSHNPEPEVGIHRLAAAQGSAFHSWDTRKSQDATRITASKTKARSAINQASGPKKVWAKIDTACTALAPAFLHVSTSRFHMFQFSFKVHQEKDVLAIILSPFFKFPDEAFSRRFSKIVEVAAQVCAREPDGASRRVAIQKAVVQRLWERVLRVQGLQLCEQCKGWLVRLFSLGRKRLFNKRIAEELHDEDLSLKSPLDVQSVVGRALNCGMLWLRFVNRNEPASQLSLSEVEAITKVFNSELNLNCIESASQAWHPWINCSLGWSEPFLADGMYAMVMTIYDTKLVEDKGEEALTLLANTEREILSKSRAPPADGSDGIADIITSALTLLLYLVLVAGYEGTPSFDPQDCFDKYAGLPSQILPWAAKTVAIYCKESPLEYRLTHSTHLQWLEIAVQKHRDAREGREGFKRFAQGLTQPPQFAAPGKRLPTHRRTPSDPAVPANLLDFGLLGDDARLGGLMKALHLDKSL